MIILDTDVLSAMMRPEQNPAVMTWLDVQEKTVLHMTVISLHELQFGIELLPAGRRKQMLSSRLDTLRARAIAKPLLGLDKQGAVGAATVRAAAQRASGHCDVADALIAGIALGHRARIATRNARHYLHFGVPLVDPWAA